MQLRRLLVLSLIAVIEFADSASVQNDTNLNDTELVLAFVLFRHGDRAPVWAEVDMLSQNGFTKDLLFPYGLGALTNKGKQRSYKIGQYLRDHYDGFISKLYLPDEIYIQTTDYDRTKMSLLAALAALYIPPPAQKWSPDLNWQPVPYDMKPIEDDYQMYFRNCPNYLVFRDRAMENRENKVNIEQYDTLFSELSAKVGRNLTVVDVLRLDGGLHGFEDLNLPLPEWAHEYMPQIDSALKVWFGMITDSTELLRLSAGVSLSEFIKAANAAIAGREQPKMRLYSSHETNVAQLMAAVQAYDTPHQPEYGATFSLELRKTNGQYGVMAVYSPVGGAPAQVLPMRGCGGSSFCDYETFLKMVQDIVLSEEEYKKECVVNKE